MKSKKLILIYFIAITIPVFAQQADLSLIPYRQGDLWGYADAGKKIIIKPVYDQANLFYEGYASVKKGEKFGYINKAGKVLIPFNYYIAKPFRYGYFDNPARHKTDTVLFAGASVRKDGYEICINTKGATMPRCPAINENTVIDHFAEDTSVKTYSNIKANGNLYDKIVDDYNVINGDDNYYIAVKNNLLGVFNNKFSVVIPFEYSSLKKLTIGAVSYLLAEKKGKQGVLNGNGSAFIAVENATVSFAKSTGGKEYFIILRENTGSIMDTRLTKVISGNYTDIVYDKEGGFVLTGPEKMKGYYFENTKVLINTKYADVTPVKDGNFIWVTTPAGKSGYVSSKGDDFFSE